MDTNLSITSNELNKVMRTMTAASIILMVDALIASIYGMNFVNMPELHWEYGYFIVLIVMATLTTGLIMYFRWLKWL
jgi:magnesium transporter